MAIRVGVGGWTYPPWRGSFYPRGLKASEELAFASRRFSAIEINATFYGRQPPARFTAWARTAPEGFVFAVKGSRFCTVRKDLATAGEAVDGFLAQGLEGLGPALGPIVWQLAPTKRFNPAEIEAFLGLLPDSLAGLPLRHVLEVRHQSFVDPAFLALARSARVGIVLADGPDRPLIADQSGTLAYLRLMRAEEEVPTGYAPDALALWAQRARSLAAGADAEGLDLLAPAPEPLARDVFVFAIDGAKVRAPAAAEALLGLLGGPQSAASSA